MASAHTIQMLGLIGAASYLAARLARGSGKAAFHRYAIVAQPRAALPPMPRGFCVRALGPHELARYRVDVGPEVQARRFAEGLTCLAAFDAKQRLTGLVWLREHRHDEDEVAVRFLLPAGCCWDTGLWIAPQHRMGRSFAALWAGAGEWMDARGLTHSLSRISDYNLPALLAHKRMGAQVLAHRSFVQLGKWQWSAGARPRLIRLDGARGAELDLRGVLAGGG
ncbi:MAG TPA: hypothetical protein PLL44_07650 [Novosphingobium sp.]|jgi:hypothetical protein|nr:hypothetical protein [Novosphingobium sp.]HPB22700.1 hypothetical protein [Novosphingobium sp.]HQD98500.1 hypothetical protein [Novosphingobium sp.]HQN54291.1 hypothetical protein [Novosphingobium sp.]HQQ07855.1 hypothetical protein [Novosphingobium sp.]